MPSTQADIIMQESSSVSINIGPPTATTSELIQEHRPISKLATTVHLDATSPYSTRKKYQKIRISEKATSQTLTAELVLGSGIIMFVPIR